MMLKRRTILGFLLMVGLFLPVMSRAGAAPLTMAYTVSVGDRAAGLFHVELRLDGWPGGPQLFRMPVWMPGYYGLMDYPSAVQGFQALDSRGRPFLWEKPAADAWRIQTGRAARFTIRYDVKVPAPFITQSGLNEKRAYIAPHGHLSLPGRAAQTAGHRGDRARPGLERRGNRPRPCPRETPHVRRPGLRRPLRQPHLGRESRAAVLRGARRAPCFLRLRLGRFRPRRLRRRLEAHGRGGRLPFRRDPLQALRLPSRRPRPRRHRARRLHGRVHGRLGLAIPRRRTAEP